MATATMDQGATAPPPGRFLAPILPRRRTLLVATALGSGATIMFFAGMLGIYLSERADFLRDNPGGSWIPSSVTVELTAPSVIAWTLLLSIVTMQWAVYSAARDDRPHTLIATSVTALFGVAVINQFVFLYKQLGLEIDAGGVSTAPVLIYAVTGTFLLILVVALTLLATMSFRALAGGDLRSHVDGMAAASLYWYVMVFVYMIVWVAIFITK